MSHQPYTLESDAGAEDSLVKRLLRARAYYLFRLGIVRISQEDIAQKISETRGVPVHQTTVSSWFRGRIPDTANIAAAASVFGVDPGWLAFGNASNATMTNPVIRAHENGGGSISFPLMPGAPTVGELPPTGPLDSISQRLKEAMVRRGVSNSDLAEVLGVHVKTVSAWRTGAQPPSQSILRRIANILDLPSDWYEAPDIPGPGFLISKSAVLANGPTIGVSVSATYCGICGHYAPFGHAHCTERS